MLVISVHHSTLMLEVAKKKWVSFRVVMSRGKANWGAWVRENRGHEIGTLEKRKEEDTFCSATQRLQDSLMRSGALQFVILKCSDIEKYQFIQKQDCVAI